MNKGRVNLQKSVIGAPPPISTFRTENATISQKKSAFQGQQKAFKNTFLNLRHPFHIIRTYSEKNSFFTPHLKSDRS